MSKEILLTKGKVAIVDDEDYSLVMDKAPWYVLQNGYAARSDYIKGTGKSKMVYLHRFLLNAGKGQCVDHINSNRLDNRRQNIRLCSIIENNRNIGKRRKSISKYKGISYVKANTNRKWEAYISVNRRKIHCGYFSTEDSAAKAYDFYAKCFYKEFANLNFKESECLLKYKPTTNKTETLLNYSQHLSPVQQCLKEKAEMDECCPTLVDTM